MLCTCFVYFVASPLCYYYNNNKTTIIIIIVICYDYYCSVAIIGCNSTDITTVCFSLSQCMYFIFCCVFGFGCCMYRIIFETVWIWYDTMRLANYDDAYTTTTIATINVNNNKNRQQLNSRKTVFVNELNREINIRRDLRKW